MGLAYSASVPKRVNAPFAWVLMGLLVTLCACRGTAEAPSRTAQPSADSSAGPALLVSGQKTKVYHLRDCLYARDIPVRELKEYQTPGEALRDGKISCAVCKPARNGAAGPTQEKTVSRISPSSSTPNP